MQNTDYAKKFRKRKSFSQVPEVGNLSTSKTSGYSHERKSSKIYHPHITSESISKFEFAPSISLWYVLVIGVFLFTSGLFVGMRISQRESAFASGEVQSFKNISENSESSISERTRAEISETSPESEENSTFSSIPRNLQFPPKLNQTNYMIQLGTFSPEDANKYAASLIHERQEFQGRVFRTSTGKLYLGFYYDLREAKNVLKKIKKFQGGIFQEAEIKSVQF